MPEQIRLDFELLFSGNRDLTSEAVLAFLRKYSPSQIMDAVCIEWNQKGNIDRLEYGASLLVNWKESQGEG